MSPVTLLEYHSRPDGQKAFGPEDPTTGAICRGLNQAKMWVKMDKEQTTAIFNSALQKCPV